MTMTKGPAPQLWITGPCPITHDKYVKWAQQKNQAQWRNERWLLTFEEWCDLWGTRWDQRGRGGKSYCLSRKNYDQEWSLDNVHVITRGDHVRQQFAHKRKLKMRALDRELA